MSNLIFLLCLIFFLAISSISLGQWTNLNSSIFDNFSDDLPRFYEIIHREVFSLCVTYIVLSCLYLKSIYVKPINSFLSSNIFFPIAQVSYSAYLFHEMFMLWFFPKFIASYGDMLPDLQIIIFNTLISIIAILFGATFMYIFIEQPFQDLKNRITIRTEEIKIEKTAIIK